MKEPYSEGMVIGGAGGGKGRRQRYQSL